MLGAATNSEGWAHYCEQMVIDEGFHADDPRYRLAQVQDALLRDARFIVGIRMHTKGMTVAEAEEFFVKEGYQSRPVARSESKRGTSDPTYGYYTMGKLMILKLRDDYRAKRAPDSRCRTSTTRSSSSGRFRCRSCGRRCSAKPAGCFSAMQKVNLAQKLSQIGEYWRPKVVGELNGQEVKLVKFKGEFVWHHHEHEDELFLVVRGTFRVEFRDRIVTLTEGELVIVPRGVEHRTAADDEYTC